MAVQPAVPPSKHAAGRTKPPSAKDRRRARRAQAMRIRDYLDSQAYATVMEALQGRGDGPGT